MRVVFIGTGEIGVPVLRWLLANERHELAGIVTQPDKPVGRDQRIQAPPIKVAAGASGVPILQPRRIKHDDAVTAIRALQPDVIVVMAYGQILPRTVLEIPRVACLNLHASLLPKHRGAAPIQATILAGDSATGITVMCMDEGLDTGDILLESRISIAPEANGGSLHDQMAEIAPAALAEALEQLESGAAPRVPQDAGAATYAPKLEREDGLIDWTQPAETIERKVRAFDPWPGAYTVLRESQSCQRKLKIFRAKIVDSGPLVPGQLAASAEGLTIGSSGAALLLTDVQIEGKKRMSAIDLLRGNSWIATATILPTA